MKRTNTKEKAIQIAKGKVQTFGFNAFSFQHIADDIGIKKASLYDHFESKEKLGNDLVDNYKESYAEWAAGIESLDPDGQISGFFDIFYKFARLNTKYCPLVAFTADIHTLPKSLQRNVKSLYDFEKNWLEASIKKGQASGLYRTDKTVRALTDVVFAIAVGGQFLARINSDSKKIAEMKEQAIRYLKSK